MDKKSRRRWIKAMLIQAESGMPGLPWERATKQTRRAQKAQQTGSIAAQ